MFYVLFARITVKIEPHRSATLPLQQPKREEREVRSHKMWERAKEGSAHGAGVSAVSSRE